MSGALDDGDPEKKELSGSIDQRAESRKTRAGGGINQRQACGDAKTKPLLAGSRLNSLAVPTTGKSLESAVNVWKCAE
ncbi:MAG TPA: hypothetical protein VMV75_01735 [Sulfuricella sp.]|nr:hypothetical protein [Sulfuricella sp.]